MAAPYSPYRKIIQFTSTASGTKRQVYYLDAIGVKQKPPYENSAYSVNIYRTLKGFQNASSWARGISPAIRDVAINRARSKMINQLGDTSSIGATLTAERKETFGMLTGFTLTALQSVKAVKKGQLGKAAALLGIAPPVKTTIVKLKKIRGRKITKVSRTGYVLPNTGDAAKSIGNKWLWWSYGVKPLMGDLYNSLDVLQREAPWKKIEGYARATGVETNSYGNGVWNQYHDDCKIKMSINVRVKNPNLFLANQLGLTNPVQWVNEAIPFSFVVDWFSNLSQVISQMTDFVGLETADPVTAEKSSVKFQSIYWPDLSWGEMNYIQTWVSLKRTLSIPEAKLKFAYERFSWRRGANAISLLVQFLPKSKSKFPKGDGEYFN